MTKNRRPLPGEGSDRLGTNFDGFQPAGDSEDVSFNFSSRGLTPQLQAWEALWGQNLETGRLAATWAVSTYLGLPFLRAFWPFTSTDENEDPYDLSGQGRTLDRTSVTYGAAGAADYAPIANFGAVNTTRYFSRASETGLTWTGLPIGFMAAAWVLPQWTTTSGLAPIISKGDGATADEYGVHVNRSTMRVRVVAGDDSYDAPASRALTLNAWNFVAAGYIVPLDTYVVMVNSLHGSAIGGGSPTLSATADPFYVGRYDGASGDEYWQGQMAYVALFSSLVSEALLRNVQEGTRYLFGV